MFESVESGCGIVGVAEDVVGAGGLFEDDGDEYEEFV